MSGWPLTQASTRELLATLGHDPRRWLGQNFLVDPNLVRKSLVLGEVAPGDRVVEVGPGLGTLTGTLLEAGAQVWAVEKDVALAAHLRATFGARPAFNLLEGDAVEHPLAGIPEPERGFKVVANLPYAISSPWMEAVCLGPHPERLVLMLQREAAERLTAEVGTGHWSALTIQVDLAFERVGLHPVPPGVLPPGSQGGFLPARPSSAAGCRPALAQGPRRGARPLHPAPQAGRLVRQASFPGRPRGRRLARQAPRPRSRQPGAA